MKDAPRRRDPVPESDCRVAMRFCRQAHAFSAFWSYAAQIDECMYGLLT